MMLHNIVQALPVLKNRLVKIKLLRGKVGKAVLSRGRRRLKESSL